MPQPTQVFTIAQAAAACAVSRKTITRRIDQLQDAGAYKDASGQWVVPLSALLSAGLRPGRPAPPDHVPLSQDTNLGHEDNVGHVGQVAELRLELADLRRRAEVAEALAAERAERIADLRLALRQLEAPPAPGRAPNEPALPTPANSPQQPEQDAGLLGSVRRWLLHG